MLFSVLGACFWSGLQLTLELVLKVSWLGLVLVGLDVVCFFFFFHSTAPLQCVEDSEPLQLC